MTSRNRLPRSHARMAAPLLVGALLVGALAAGAQTPSPDAKPRSMQEILDGSKAADWRNLDPMRTLYMDLDAGRVVIELAPEFAPAHVANIRALAKGGYWNGLSINRSQDNFVVQWGDPAEEEKDRKPLSKGAKPKLPAEFTRSNRNIPFTPLPDADGWARQVGFSDSFPIGLDTSDGSAWLAHCYGAVGAGRDVAADSSTGAELYVVIGQSPRQLDRNITTVGRVVQGMELLSVLPRGTGPLGFYEKPEQRVAIRSIRLAADLKPAERLKLQVLRTDTPLFTELVEARRNRRDDFYKRPAGHIDLCNVPLPVRTAPEPAAKPKR
jgi:cyclophilin family peptidyl-prolyl cis-trans isomerase